jgi:hypothetical protein
MVYTYKQRRQLATAFRKALKRVPATLGQDDNDELDYYVSPYICDNISSTSNPETADLATGLIAERIQHLFSVERWLKEQSTEIADALQHDVLCNDGRKLQEYRKAWLKSLIAEFSEPV